MLVGLDEPARPDTGAQLGAPGVVDRAYDDVAHRLVLDVGVAASGGEQAQEVRLARSVRAEDGDALAVPDLEVEGPHQAGELQRLADHRALAGAAAGEPHRDLLLARLLGRRTRLLELREPGDRKSTRLNSSH